MFLAINFDSINFCKCEISATTKDWSIHVLDIYNAYVWLQCFTGVEALYVICKALTTIDNLKTALSCHKLASLAHAESLQQVNNIVETWFFSAAHFLGGYQSWHIVHLPYTLFTFRKIQKINIFWTVANRHNHL